MFQGYPGSERAFGMVTKHDSQHDLTGLLGLVGAWQNRLDEKCIMKKHVCFLFLFLFFLLVHFNKLFLNTF